MPHLSLVPRISEDRAYPLEVRPGPLDLGLQWTPSAAHIAVVSTIHTITLGAVGFVVLMMIGVICIMAGA